MKFLIFFLLIGCGAAKKVVDESKKEPKGKWELTSKYVSFIDAFENIPAGYMVPTRAQLIQGFDDGELTDMVEPVWSQTRRDDKVWVVRLLDGKTELVEQSDTKETIYILIDERDLYRGERDLDFQQFCNDRGYKK